MEKIMPIKNYTSNVDSFTSLGELQGALARGGASKILVNYDGGKPIGVMFALQNERGVMNFALPANVDGVPSTCLSITVGFVRTTAFGKPSRRLNTSPSVARK